MAALWAGLVAADLLTAHGSARGNQQARVSDGTRCLSGLNLLFGAERGINNVEFTVVAHDNRAFGHFMA